jgi:hypothetical protein
MNEKLMEINSVIRKKNGNSNPPEIHYGATGLM